MGDWRSNRGTLFDNRGISEKLAGRGFPPVLLRNNTWGIRGQEGEGQSLLEGVTGWQDNDLVRWWGELVSDR